MIMFRIVNIYFFQSFPTLDTVSFYFYGWHGIRQSLESSGKRQGHFIINESENKMVLDTLLS